MLTVVVVPLAVELMWSLRCGQGVDRFAAPAILFQITVVLGTVGGLGVRRLALAVTAGESADARAAFRYDRWSEWIAFSVVFGCSRVWVSFQCVIPGVLFLAYFGLAPYFFLDRGLGIRDSLRASRDAVVSKGIAFSVLLMIVVGVLGVVVCVIGVVVSEAVAALALAFLYRYATDQPVAASQPPWSTRRVRS